jgi:hypothetical protein
MASSSKKQRLAKDHSKTAIYIISLFIYKVNVLFPFTAIPVKIKQYKFYGGL